jgi:hypothetical protein
MVGNLRLLLVVSNRFMSAKLGARVVYGTVLIASFAACGSDRESASVLQAQVPSTWRRFETPPLLESPEVSCSLHTNARWRVFFEGTTLGVAPANNVRERDPIPYEIDFSDVLGSSPSDSVDVRQWRLRYSREQAARIVTRVSDGWLIGFAAGENGGSLWWYPLTPGRGRKLWPQNVLSIVQPADSSAVIVLSGLAHLSSDEGVALWIGRDSAGNWQVLNRAKLRGAPYARAAHPHGIVVAHTTGIDLVSPDQTIQSLASVTHWMSSPVSVAVGQKGEIAVGRGLFVSLFRPDANGYSEEVYLPAQCAQFRDDGLMCFCEEER